MRLLVLLQARTPDDQIGYHTGFTRLVEEGALEAYVPVCYRNPDDSLIGAPLHSEAARRFTAQDCDAVLLQFFHGSMPPPDPLIATIRRARPDALVLASCGDPFGRWFHRLPCSMRRAAALADLSFFTGMGHIADTAVSAGAHNVLLLPNGCCQVRFPHTQSLATQKATADVVFIGSRHAGRNPLTQLSRAARWRRRMISALQRRFGLRFRLFGHGWQDQPSWQGPLPFDRQIEAMKNARVVVGGYPSAIARYYTSDRSYFSLASGVPFTDFAGPGIDRLFTPGEHWYPYHDIPSLLRQVDALLEADPGELGARALRTAAWIAQGHTHYHRCAEMVRLAKELREYRRRGRRMPPPPATFLQPQADPIAELPFTARNWVG